MSGPVDGVNSWQISRRSVLQSNPLVSVSTAQMPVSQMH
ncbi:hypothetical protein FM103_19690 [Corynebacterium xerosis]|nr:hypothetical protein FM103_19690 [Corynebacterium xerosis]